MRSVSARSAWVLCLLLSGCASPEGGPGGFPKTYLLQAAEIPPGLALSGPAPGLPEANPGQLNDANLSGYAPQFGAALPNEAWLERFTAAGSNGSRISLFAGMWDTNAQAQAAVENAFQSSQGRVCAGLHTSGEPPTLVRDVLRDYVVIVIVTGDGGSNPKTLVDSVITAIQTKSPGLKSVC